MFKLNLWVICFISCNVFDLGTVWWIFVFAVVWFGWIVLLLFGDGIDVLFSYFVLFFYLV